jgi:uncharacterized protein YukE
LADDDYELVPHREIEGLKSEVERLKKAPAQASSGAGGKSLSSSVEELNLSIKKLIELFTNTEAELSKDYAEHNPIEEFKEIKRQNEQIAQAILALADLVRDLKSERLDVQQSQPSRYNPLPLQPQPTPYPQGQYPLPVPPDNIVSQDFNPNSVFPPPPLDLQPAVGVGEKKKGLFFRK